LSWAEKTLAVLDQQPASVLQHCTAERLEEKFGWLREYRQDLATWQEYEAISPAVFEVVREGGYGHGVSGLAAERSRGQVQSDAGEILQSELLTSVSQQSSLVPEGSRLPGSTEVLESSFGKFKSLEGDRQKGGFTSLILSYAALLGETTTALIAAAIESPPWKRVQCWYRAHLGLTVQGKRVIAHQSVTAEPAQQNPEEPQEPATPSLQFASVAPREVMAEQHGPLGMVVVQWMLNMFRQALMGAAALPLVGRVVNNVTCATAKLERDCSDAGGLEYAQPSYGGLLWEKHGSTKSVGSVFFLRLPKAVKLRSTFDG